MTAKDRARMARLERENAELHAAINKHMDVYRSTLCELVEVKTTLGMIEDALAIRNMRGDDVNFSTKRGIV